MMKDFLSIFLKDLLYFVPFIAFVGVSTALHLLGVF